jgi:hypothetical protein
MLLAAALALEPCKASAGEAAVEEALELLPYERGQRDRHRPVVDGAVERGEVVAHDGV